MVAIIPPIWVDKPTPSLPLRYGLLQAAVGPLDFPSRHGRGGGVQYVETMCGGGQGYEIDCLDDLDTKVFNENGLNVVTGVPFVVMSNYTCVLAEQNAVGVAEQRTLEKLLSVEQSIVEQVFSSGTFAAAPALATNPDVVTVVTAATDLVDVISELENAMYCTSQYGPPAYLHMPFAVFNRLKSEHLIEFDGQRWRTPAGSVVSPGCYTALEPDGDVPAPGTFWIYATGQTVVWRSAEPFIAPVEAALNRTTNEYTGLAEREYAVTFECAVYAAPVTLWTETP